MVEFLGINHAAFFVPTDLWDPQHALGEGGRKREREREREREAERRIEGHKGRMGEHGVPREYDVSRMYTSMGKGSNA